jgi:pimeloyl-ACP methyl ester carboxylesterase
MARKDRPDHRSRETRSDPFSGETVILVPGLWMTGLELGLLRRRLVHEHGFDVRVFAYPTMDGDPGEICGELADTVRRGEGARVHLVGHSLGGAFVYRALTECASSLSGNAVLLGSPLNGSRAARGALRWPVLRPLLGSHVVHELAEPCGREWHGPAALGAIAGSRPLGTGQFFAHFDEDNDGTVAVRETVIPGLSDHIVLPHSHIGMLFAGDVAAQVAHFLRHGHFEGSASRRSISASDQPPPSAR